MSDQVQSETTGQAPSPDVQAIIDQAIEKARVSWDNQIRGLDRKNSQLQKELEEKSLAGRSIEERIAAIEKAKVLAERRAATMEAFGKHGLGENFRSLFDIEDPEERASTMKSLLEDYGKELQKKVAAQFVRDPEAAPVEGGGRMYSMEQMKGLSTDQINKLFAEGRVQGLKKGIR